MQAATNVHKNVQSRTRHCPARTRSRVGQSNPTPAPQSRPPWSRRCRRDRVHASPWRNDRTHMPIGSLSHRYQLGNIGHARACAHARHVPGANLNVVGSAKQPDPRPPNSPTAPPPPPPPRRPPWSRRCRRDRVHASPWRNDRTHMPIGSLSHRYQLGNIGHARACAHARHVPGANLNVVWPAERPGPRPPNSP